MSETENLTVQERTDTGTTASRRLRKSGMIPAVLYGHGEANRHLAIPQREVMTALRHHSKTVNLTGAVTETALVSQVHYDPLGIDVLHLDLIRVNLREKVEVTVPIHTKGDAIGARSGGILLENVHEVDIRCSAGSIPDALELDVSDLQLGGHLNAGDLKLPEGVELVTDAETMLVHIEAPKGADSAGGEGGSSEPEVIAKGSPDSGE
ncbi:MAG: 50S ribosomal protein L25 [Planctomycetota bacterium]